MTNVQLLKSLRPKVYEAIVEMNVDIEHASATELFDEWLKYEGIINYTDTILRALSAILAATKDNVYGVTFNPETFNPEDLIHEVSEKIGLTVDFPNCFYIPVDDIKHLVFGYANRGLGYNLADNETGEVFDSGELLDDMGVLIANQTVENQVWYIKIVCEKYCIELL